MSAFESFSNASAETGNGRVVAAPVASGGLLPIGIHLIFPENKTCILEAE